MIDQEENKTTTTTNSTTMIKNIVLMGSAATTMADLAHYQKVGFALEYMHQMLAKNGRGFISVQEAISDP